MVVLEFGGSCLPLSEIARPLVPPSSGRRGSSISSLTRFFMAGVYLSTENGVTSSAEGKLTVHGLREVGEVEGIGLVGVIDARLSWRRSGNYRQRR